MVPAKSNAVSIASPISLHYEQGMAALEAALDVHFNKPLALTFREAQELAGTAARNEAVIVASPGEALLLETEIVRDILREGKLGKVSWAICGAGFDTYHQDEPERAEVPGREPFRGEWYYHRPGGGPVYDMTVYALHDIVSVLGPVHAVVAMSGIILRERVIGGKPVKCDADDNTLAVLDFGDSLFAYCYGAATGSIGGGRMPTYFGEQGSIDGYYFGGEPLNQAAVGLAAELGLPYTGNERLLSTWMLPHANACHRQIPEVHVFEDVVQLAEARAQGRPPTVPVAQAVHVVEVMEAMYTSAREGVRVELTSCF